ncbi:MAG: WG repeat-containing protein [Bacteroidota bacterium]
MTYASWRAFSLPILFLLFLIDPVVHLAQSPLLPICESGKWGLIDTAGQRVIVPRFSFVQPLVSGRIKVGDGQGQGIIDRTGKWMLEPEYDRVFVRSDSIVWYRKRHRWGYKHLPSGRQRPPVYHDHLWFTHRYHEMQEDAPCPGPHCGKILYSLVTGDARVVLPPQPYRLEPEEGDLVRLRDRTLLGYWDLKSGQRIPVKYTALLHLGELKFAATDSQGTWLLGMNGQPILQQPFLSLEQAPYGWLSYEDAESSGLISKRGIQLSAQDYPDIRPLGPDQFAIQAADGWVLNRADGTALTPVPFASLEILRGEWLRAAGQTHIGAINLRGDIVIPFQYDELEVRADDSGFFGRRAGHWTWLDAMGQPGEVTGADRIHPSRKGHFHFEKDGKHGLFDQRGKIVLPARFTALNWHDERIEAFTGNEKTSYYIGEDGRLFSGNRFILRRDPREGRPENVGRRGRIRRRSRMWYFDRGNEMYGLRDTISGDTLISARYHYVFVVPGTELSLTRRHYAGRDHFGLVNHARGRVLIKPVLQELKARDFIENEYARIILPNGRRSIVHRSGKVINSHRIRYVGPFVDGVARVMVDGGLQWKPESHPTYQLEERPAQSDWGGVTRQYLYAKKGKWGYLKGDGKWLVKPTYDFAADFAQEIAFVQQGKLWGVLDTTGAEIVPVTLERLQRLTVAGRPFIKTARFDGRFGYIDAQGNPITGPRFAAGNAFSEGLAAVKFAGKWGYIDLQGEWVIPAQYDAAADFHEGFARVRQGRFWQFIDRRGTPLAGERFVRAGDFHQGRAWAHWGGRAGYLDTQGGWAVPPQFLSAEDFQHGLAVVRTRRGYGMIDREGNLVVKARYRSVRPFSEGMAVVRSKNGAYGAVDSLGQLAVRSNYRKMGDFRSGRAWVRTGQWSGYVDRTGKVVIKGKFSELRDFHAGRAAVRMREGWGFVDRFGQMVIAPQYVRVQDFGSHRAAGLKQGQWYVFDRRGADIRPPEASWAWVGPFREGIAAVRTQHSHWLYLDSLGNVLRSAGGDSHFSAVQPFADGLGQVARNQAWVLVDQEGNPWVQTRFAAPVQFSEGRAGVVYGYKYGLISCRGEVLLEATHDVVQTTAGLIQVFNGAGVGYLHPGGNWRWKLPEYRTLGAVRGR